MASDHRGKPLHAGKRTDDEQHEEELSPMWKAVEARQISNAKWGLPYYHTDGPEWPENS